MAEKITLLGSSGSIGVSTLDVIARHPERYEVFALTGHSRVDVLAQQCQQFMPSYAVVGSQQAAKQLAALVDKKVKVLWGEQALVDVAAASEVDTVMAAIVGAAGLLPTLAAAQQGKRMLLANKEALVMAGGLFMEAVAKHRAILLPIDSEHNAIFQCLPHSHNEQSALGAGSGASPVGVTHVLLSASGGPFRSRAVDTLSNVTPAEACAHPNWSMGRKISVDSATMMNKGLEVIEACWLFHLQPSQVDVVIHPQSIIHSLVSYVDGSMLAQLGNPDMRTPIAHALAWPERIASGVAPLNLLTMGSLDFEAPDLQRFPCLKLAEQAAESALDFPTALNAANEIAVAAFLAERIPYTRIPDVVAGVMENWQGSEPVDLAAVQHSDTLARQLAQGIIKGI